VARRLRSCAAALWEEQISAHAQASSLKLLVGHGGAFRHAARELGILSSEQVVSLSMGYGVPVYFEVQRPEGGSDRFVQIAGHWRPRQVAGAID
jgi:2,3-bisphosphoglycerate-dependent phosphoglycerate mutase